MDFILECYEQLKFYDYMLFDSVFMYRVNFMPVILNQKEYFYYQYDNNILLLNKKINNQNYFPSIISLNEYVNFINKSIQNEAFIITFNDDNYNTDYNYKIYLIDISRSHKLKKIIRKIV